MKTRILCIDDDPSTLDSYRAALEGHADQWEIECSQNPAESLANFEQQPADVVIASLRLDNHDGIDLLKQISAVAPDSQRFIAVADEDKAKIEPGLGSIYQYLPKPCPADRLITEIQRCLAIDTWLGNDAIKTLVAKMGDFPSLPPMYLKVVNALNRRDASIEEIGRAISGDIAISAKLLQVVNSSYYGFEDKISDITQAVGILGIEEVKHLVLAIQVFGKLGRSPDQKALTDQLWHHSMSVAVAAKRIMQHETGDEKAAEEAYTAGLLHDLGKLVMINAAPEEFTQARALARENRIPSWQAENEVMRCNHAETGAYVLARWGMPAPVVEAVALHHEPHNTSGTTFSSLSAVHVANALVWERKAGDQPSPEAQPDPSFLAEIGRAGSWETWQDVVSGKATERKAPPAPSAEKESVASAESSGGRAVPEAEAANAAPAPANPKPATSAPTPSAALAEESPSVTQPSSPSKSSSARWPIAIAACLALGLGGYFLSPRAAELLRSATDPTATEPAPTSASEKSSKPNALPEAFGSIAQSDFDRELDRLIQEDLEGEQQAHQAEQPPAAKQDALAASPTPATPTLKETSPVANPTPASVAPGPLPPEPASAPALAAKEPSPAEAFPQPKLPKESAFFPEILLSGIFYNADTPLASVNGKIRRVGDTVSGAKIVKIEQKRIVVSYEDQLRDYRLR